MACNGVSFETLSPMLALPHLRCLTLNRHAVRYPMSCCLQHACQTECSHSKHSSNLCYLILLPLAASPFIPLLCLHVRRSMQVQVLRQNGGALAPLLAHAGSLKELRLACGHTVGLPQLLSGLSGLERLAMPAMLVVLLWRRHDALSCLSELTQLTGGC